MEQSLYIGFGAFLGANLRSFLIQFFLRFAPFPAGVLICNLTGSFLAGFFAAFAAKTHPDPMIGKMFSVGFLGSLTTFSTFALDTVQLYQNQPSLSLINILANLAGSLVFAFLGGLLCQKSF